MHPDDPLAPVVAEVAREAASVREKASRLEASVAEIVAALGAARLVDQRTADDLVRKLAASADATVKTTARAEVREGVRRMSALLAGLGVALVLASLGCGFVLGLSAAPACPTEHVRESGGARWCWLGQVAAARGR